MKKRKITTVPRGTFKDKIRCGSFQEPRQIGFNIFKLYSVEDNREIIIKTFKPNGGKHDSCQN